MTLPRPGAVGIVIRIGLGLAVAYWGLSTASQASVFVDGRDRPLASLWHVLPLALFSPVVVREAFGRRVGAWTMWAVAGLLAVAIAVGAWQGAPFGPAYGVLLWLWVMAFTFLLAPALLLAAALRTPGCEMRSYRHLIARIRGRRVEPTACRGCIDRLDGVRLRPHR